MSKGTFLVGGCMRGGTSLAAGILDRLGINMGTEMRKPSKYNPKGFYEDVEFMRQVTNIIELGGNNPWDYSPDLEKIKKSFDTYYEEMLLPLVEERNANFTYWGAKGSLNFILSSLCFKVQSPRVLIIIRNTYDNAKSIVNLGRGYGVDRALDTVFINQKILFSYESEFIKHKIPYIYVSYDELLRNTSPEIVRICNKLKIELSVDKLKAITDYVGK